MSNAVNEIERLQVLLTGSPKQHIDIAHIKDGQAGLAGLVDDDSDGGHFWSAIESSDRQRVLARISDPTIREFITGLLR